MHHRFEIIAFPHGERAIVAEFAGGCAEGIVRRAIAHAKVRGEFVDVHRDGVHIAVVGEEGPVEA